VHLWALLSAKLLLHCHISRPRVHLPSLAYQFLGSVVSSEWSPRHSPGQNRIWCILNVIECISWKATLGILGGIAPLLPLNPPISLGTKPLISWPRNQKSCSSSSRIPRPAKVKRHLWRFSDTLALYKLWARLMHARTDILTNGWTDRQHENKSLPNSDTEAQKMHKSNWVIHHLDYVVYTLNKQLLIHSRVNSNDVNKIDTVHKEATLEQTYCGRTGDW